MTFLEGDAMYRELQEAGVGIQGGRTKGRGNAEGRYDFKVNFERSIADILEEGREAEANRETL